MRLPATRGPLSNFIIEHLKRAPHKLPGLLAPADDPLRGDDFHLALFCCYRIHAGSFDGVDPAWEWNPTLIDFRAGLERRFDTALRMNSDPVGIREPMTIVDGAATYDRVHAPAAAIARAGTAEHLDDLLEDRALMRGAVAAAWPWMLRRLSPDAAVAMISFGAALNEQPQDGTPDLSQVSGTSLARANVVSLLALNGAYGSAAGGAFAVLETIDARSDRALATAARRLGRIEQAKELDDAAARAERGLARQMAQAVAAEPGARTAVGLGADWMLSATRRWAAIATGRARARREDAGQVPLTPRSTSA